MAEKLRKKGMHEDVLDADVSSFRARHWEVCASLAKFLAVDGEKSAI